jgi:signal transduction histidine kinase
MSTPEPPQDFRAAREETDESLKTERQKTDELAHADAALRAAKEATEERLREVRADVDGELGKQKEALPQVSETLEQVAETLNAAATSLSGIADAIEHSAAATMEAATAAEQVADAAEIPREPPVDRANDSDQQPPVQQVVEQLAAVASGMADVTAALVEERDEADQQLERERATTDRILENHADRARAIVSEQLPAEADTIADARQATDAQLAEEREITDHAVEHVLDLLSQERHARASVMRKSATRNEFLGIVSHDLRAPLTTITIIAKLIGESAPDDESGRRVRNWVHLIGRSVNTMERLIGDLLDFASLEDGRLRVVATSHDVSDTIRKSVEAFQPQASSKSISLAADLREPITAVFDEQRIEQVLSNLLENAVKFTPEGGTIRVRADAAGGEALVTVADTGVGIPKGEETAVFERFRRVHESDTPGLGLGLYTSKWIVEAHQGRIWCESPPDGGSAFHFTLPLE